MISIGTGRQPTPITPMSTSFATVFAPMARCAWATRGGDASARNGAAQNRCFTSTSKVRLPSPRTQAFPGSFSCAGSWANAFISGHSTDGRFRRASRRSPRSILPCGDSASLSAAARPISRMPMPSRRGFAMPTPMVASTWRWSQILPPHLRAAAQVEGCGSRSGMSGGMEIFPPSPELTITNL